MKNRLIYVVILVLMASPSNAQKNRVLFDHSNWDQVLLKAQLEHKDIFVDCYATWCGPCKKMDKYVFVDSLVGSYFNSRFISVKIQMDSTERDEPEVLRWYPFAKVLQSKYNIVALPTFLFFSNRGELLHREVGFKNVNEIISVACEAQDTSKQYYKRIANYNRGAVSFSEMPALVTLAAKYGDQTMYLKIGNDYKNNFLNKLDDSDFLSKENVNYLLANYKLLNSYDRLFNYCRNFQERFDSQQQKQIARMIEYVIIKEEITDKLWNNDEIVSSTPDWKEITNSIKIKYGMRYAKKLIPNQKILFYENIGNWREYARLVSEDIQLNPPKIGDGDDAWKLNDVAWNIFVKCNDSIVISEALKWISLSIRSVGDSYFDVHNFYDTKANLFYKLGEKKKALINEGKAIQLATFSKSWMLDAYKETEYKMKNGIPTWKLN